MQVYTRIQRAFPGGAGPAVVVVSARDVTRPQVTAGIAALKRAALASGRMHEPITVEASTSRRAARVMIPLDGKGTDAASNRALDTLRGQVDPRHARQGARRHRAHHGLDGRLAGLQRLHEGARAARVRVRARARVRAAARDLPLDRHPAQGDRAEPALGRRRLRRARARLPAGPPRVAAGVHLDRRRDRLAAAVPVRDPLRALDGLPRADPQPRPRVPRQPA